MGDADGSFRTGTPAAGLGGGAQRHCPAADQGRLLQLYRQECVMSINSMLVWLPISDSHARVHLRARCLDARDLSRVR